jgi:WD40 repeat protein
MLIWHVDTRGKQADEQRKLVDVACADGRYQEAGHPVGREPDPLTGGDNLDFWSHDERYRRAHAGNLGDATDLYDGIYFTAFTPTTNPNTHRNDGTPSGLAITNIRLDPSGASFDVGWEGTPVLEVGELRLTDATSDGLLEPGELGQVTLLLQNRGEAPVGQVGVTLLFDNLVVVPTDTTVGQLLRWAGDTTTVVVPIRVAASLLPGTTVALSATVMSEQGEVQIRRVVVPLVVPDVQIRGVTVLDGGHTREGWGNGDGVPNPGEVIGLEVRVRSGTGWQPWPFPGIRLRLPDLPGGPVERWLCWQEQRADSTGILQMDGEVLLPDTWQGQAVVEGILEVVGSAGVVGVVPVYLELRGHDTTPPRVRWVTVAVEGADLRMMIPTVLVDEGGQVASLVARLVQLPDSTDVATVSLRQRGAQFVGVWRIPVGLRNVTLGVAIAATDGAGNTMTTELLRRVMLPVEHPPVGSPTKRPIARFGKGTLAQIAYSPDGTLLAVAGSAGIGLYEAHTLTEIGVLYGHTREVLSIAFHPDGTLLASGSADSTVRIWDVMLQQEIAVLRGHTGPVFAVAFSPDGTLLASGGGYNDGTVRIWDMGQQHEVAVLRGEPSQVLVGGCFPVVTAMVFSPDGKMLAVGGCGPVLLWDVARQQVVAVLGYIQSRERSMAFSPDGTLLVWGDGIGGVHVWDVAQEQEVAVLQAYGLGGFAVTFSPDGKTLAVGGWDQVQMWDMAYQQEVAVLRGHTGEVHTVAFSPDGTRFVSGSRGGTVRLWDVRHRQEVAALYGYTDKVSPVSAVAFSPNGQLLASGSEDSMVRLWDVVHQTEMTILRGSTKRIASVAFSPDGQLLASGGGDKTMRLWDVAQRQQVAALEGSTSEILSVTFNPVGHLFASGDGNTVRLWDVAQRQQVAALKGHTDVVFSVIFSPDGQILASGGRDRTVRLWDMRQQQIRAVLQGHTGVVRAVAFSPDGQTLASGGADQTVRLWDSIRQQEVAVLLGHTGGVTSVAFNPDGTLLASGSQDSTVRVWDMQHRQEIAVLRGHTDKVTSVVFNPDGTLLASGSQDGTVLLWEASPAPRTPTAVDPLPLNGSSSALPQRTLLLPAYPNPSNPDVWVPYELVHEAEVTIRIYNVTGQLVRTLVLGRKTAGRYLNRGSAAYWDGRDSAGRSVASGVYYYTLHAGTFVATRKLMVLK